MSAHVPFPEDDRSHTAPHGDPLSAGRQRAEFDALLFARIPVIDLTDETVALIDGTEPTQADLEAFWATIADALGIDNVS